MTNALYALQKRISLDPRRNSATPVAEKYLKCLLVSPCYYCGEYPSPVGGIDRFVNGMGYVHGNLCPSCSACNRAKLTYTAAVFIARSARCARLSIQVTNAGNMEAPF